MAENALVGKYFLCTNKITSRGRKGRIVEHLEKDFYLIEFNIEGHILKYVVTLDDFHLGDIVDPFKQEKYGPENIWSFFDTKEDLEKLEPSTR